MKPTIYVVEDDPDISRLVRHHLEGASFNVRLYSTGNQVVVDAERQRPALFLLDIMVPGKDGLELCRQIRQSVSLASIPVIFLTAKSGEEDRIAGLELGADDYVTKPFSPRELVLRVQAILRRGGPATGPGRASYGDGALVIDESQRQVVARGTTVDLTPTEWGILVALATVPGRVYSRFELINRVRGYEFEGYERTVDSHVKNLRRKIEEEPANPRIVQTVLGGGYRLSLTRDG